MGVGVLRAVGRTGAGRVGHRGRGGAEERLRGLVARLIPLDQHGNVAGAGAGIQLVPPPPPGGARAAPYGRAVVAAGHRGRPAVLADAGELIAGRQGAGARPFGGGAGLEEAGASGEGVAMEQVSVLDRGVTGRAFAGAHDNLDVAAVREDGEVVLRRVRRAARVRTVVALRTRERRPGDDGGGATAGEGGGGGRWWFERGHHGGDALEATWRRMAYRRRCWVDGLLGDGLINAAAGVSIEEPGEVAAREGEEWPRRWSGWCGSGDHSRVVSGQAGARIVDDGWAALHQRR